MVNRTGMLPVKFTVRESDADVSEPRRDAAKIAGRLLRAAAQSMQQGSPRPLVLDIPLDGEKAAITGASLLLLAQQIDPAIADTEQRWQRHEAARHTIDTHATPARP